MGQDGEQKPRGGGGDTGSWKCSGRGRLGVGFGVHLGCESVEVKPKKAWESSCVTDPIATPPSLAFYSVLLNSPGPEAVPLQSPVTQSLWVWELNLSLSQCPPSLSLRPTSVHHHPHQLRSPPYISDSRTPVNPSFCVTELLSPSAELSVPVSVKHPHPSSQSSSIPDAISSPITMGTILWELAGPARLTKIDGKEKKLWERKWEIPPRGRT